MPPLGRLNPVEQGGRALQANPARFRARRPNRNHLAAIQVTLEAVGVEFIPEYGGGLGLRLKKGSVDKAE